MDHRSSNINHLIRYEFLLECCWPRGNICTTSRANQLISLTVSLIVAAGLTSSVLYSTLPYIIILLLLLYIS